METFDASRDGTICSQGNLIECRWKTVALVRSVHGRAGIKSGWVASRAKRGADIAALRHDSGSYSPSQHAGGPAGQSGRETPM